MAICGFPPCDDDAREGSRYCTDAHRVANAHYRYNERQRDLTTTADAKEAVRVEYDRLQQNELRKKLQEYARGEAKREQYREVIREALEPFEPSPVIDPYQFFGEGKRTPVSWVEHDTDWHVGQLTTLASTGGLFEQTVALTRLQIDQMWAAKKEIFAVEAISKDIQRVWHCITGDIVEGDSMRASQLRGIELPVVKQAVEAADLLALQVSRELTLPGIQFIDLDLVGGNHDRTTPKPGNAGLGETAYEDTWSWIIGEFLARMFENDPRVSVTNWLTWYGTKEFAGLRHAFEHGSSSKFGGGGGYGGTPLNRIANQGRQLSAMVGGADYVWMGHWHVADMMALGQGGRLMLGGALPATTTYVQSNYKNMRVPEQWLVEFHNSKHFGPRLTTVYPLYANVGQIAPVGSLWTDATAHR